MATTDLASLILDNKGDRSYDRLSADCGGDPTAKRLQQLASKPIKNFPDPSTIEGMARGLSRPVTEVVLAAARSLGLRVHLSDDPDALVIGGVRSLMPDQREAVVALVRSFARSNAEKEVADARARWDVARHRRATVDIAIRDARARGDDEIAIRELSEQLEVAFVDTRHAAEQLAATLRKHGFPTDELARELRDEASDAESFMHSGTDA